MKILKIYDLRREDHLEMCKRIAESYLNKSEVRNAFLTFLSAMREHPDTAHHLELTVGVMAVLRGDPELETVDGMRNFINGFQ